MSQVVKALVVTFDGDTKKLKLALKDAGYELQNFQDNSNRASRTSSTAAGAVASKQANAARAIAMTTETIARQGQVSGEAAKQLLAQGSNVAFMFGPTGAIVGAIGIATLAIATMFSRARKEAEETARKARDEFRSLSEMDFTAVGRRLQQLDTGDFRLREGLAGRSPYMTREEALAFFRDDRTVAGEQGLLEERARVAGRLAALGPNIVVPLSEQNEDQRAKSKLRRELEAEIEAIDKAMADLRPRLTAVRALYKEGAAAAGEQAASRLSLLQDEAAAKELEKLERGFERAAAEGARAIAAFDKQAADFGEAFEQTALREVGSSVDRVAASFDRLIEQGTRVVGANDPRVVQLRQMKAAAIDAARATEELERVQTRKRKVAALENKAEKVLKEGSRSAADIAREIQQAVDGALQLAAAFGAIDESATTALRSIAQIAGNIPALQTALSAGSGVGIISASLPILGAVASLVGDSPAEAARREELRRNTEAIRELTERAGLLGGVGVSGSDAKRANDLVRDFLARSGNGQIIARGRTYSSSDQATIAAERLGILDELQRVADRYGITLNRNIQSFEQLADALADSITKLGEFGTELDDARRQADVEAQVYGITDPLGKLDLTLKAFAGRSAAFDALTAGLDLSDAEGRERARQNAQAMFEILRAGGDTLDADALGGLSGEELLDALLALIGGLNDLDTQAAGAAGSSLGGISGFRGLTEAAGERMADYLRGILGQGDEHLQVLRAQLAELTRIAATPFTLPAIPGVTVPLPAGASGTTFAAGAVSVSFSGDIVVQLQGSTTDPAGLGLQVSRAVREQVEEILYDSLSRALRARGDVSIIPGVR